MKDDEVIIIDLGEHHVAEWHFGSGGNDDYVCVKDDDDDG